MANKSIRMEELKKNFMKHQPPQNIKSAGQINPAEMNENFYGIINNAKIIIKKIDSILQEE